MTSDSSQVLPLSWHVVTGEYPPQHGGVADYTERLAQSLSQAGEQVHVWAPGQSAVRVDNLLTVHGLPDFGPRGLRALSKGLKAVPGRRRLLVQYVPTAYGFRGMNLAFALWLASRPSDELWVQFHEVAYDFSWSDRPQRNFLAAVQWCMAQLVAAGSERILISIPEWRRQLGRHASRAEVLPMPSNLPVDVGLDEVELARARLGSSPLVGHFGTYGRLITPLLQTTLVSILRSVSSVRMLLIGRGAAAFARTVALTHPDLATRLLPQEESTAAKVSMLLAACDVLLQPYPDGISGRRTSAMAGLALGAPIVTTTGRSTERDWESSRAVVLVPLRADDLTRAVIRLLSSESERSSLGARARSWYRARFSIEHTLQALRVDARSAKVEACRSVH